MTMTRAFPAIRGVYSLVGSIDRVSAQVFDFPHNYNQTSQRRLRGHGALSAGHRRPGVDQGGQPATREARGPGHLQCPAPCSSGPEDPRTTRGHLIASLGHLLDDLAPSSSPSRWEAARRLLATSLKVRVGVTNPSPEQLAHHELRRITRDGTHDRSLDRRPEIGRGRDPCRPALPRTCLGSTHDRGPSPGEGGPRFGVG